MKDIFVLTKALYKNSFGKNLNDKSTKTSSIGKTILILLVIAYISGVLGFLSYEIIKALIEIRQEEVFISFSLLLICAFTLFRTILTSINILYFSKDVEFLLPMPISPIKIVFAKFNIMLISNYITELILFGIPYIIYWYLLKLKFTFLLYSILVFLVIPIIPMIITSIVIVFIMRFTSFLRNKDIVQYISVILTIGVVLIIQMLTSSSTQTTEFVMANKMVEINGYSRVVTKYFFTVKQATDILTQKNTVQTFKNIVLLYLESIGAYILVVLLISKMYLKSALNATSSGIKTAKVKLKELSKRNVGITYIAKEFKELLRTPVYLLQCVLPSFLFPIIISLPIYNELKNTSNMEINFEQIDELLGNLLSNGFGVGIILLVINFLYVLNFMSVTSISREGENALFMKYIPISLSKQYKYKAIPGMIINLVPLIYILIILRIALPTLSLVLYLEIIFLSLLCNILVNYFSVLIDVINPKLHWSSEYTVVKQNINMLYSFFLSLILMGIIIGIASYVDNINVLTAILSSIMILALIVFEGFIKKFENKIFKKIS